MTDMVSARANRFLHAISNPKKNGIREKDLNKIWKENERETTFHVKTNLGIVGAGYEVKKRWIPKK